jgi:conserved protein 163
VVFFFSLLLTVYLVWYNGARTFSFYYLENSIFLESFIYAAIPSRNKMTDLGCPLLFVEDVMSSLSENIKTLINIKDRNTGQLVMEYLAFLLG